MGGNSNPECDSGVKELSQAAAGFFKSEGLCTDAVKTPGFQTHVKMPKLQIPL